MLKVLTVVGTRPEIIRLSKIIPKLDQYCNHRFIYTGQNWDRNLKDIFFEEFNLRKPDSELQLNTFAIGEQLGKIVDFVIQEIKKFQPTKMLVLGDTNSVLGATIAAKRCGVPVYHMEAGNRCFDQNVPEEINRKMIDHISDIHLPYTQNSKQYLIHEGINPSKIFVTGNPIYEVINKNFSSLEDSGFKHSYMLATIHRNENTNTYKKIYDILNFLNEIGKHFGNTVYLSVHPRIKQVYENNIEKFPWVIGFVPKKFNDFIQMEVKACCVFTDSGTVQEECCILEVPCVTIRNTTERPETIECGSNVIFNNVEDIERAISIVKFQLLNKTWEQPIEYTDMFVSEKIVKLLLGNY